MLQGIGEYIQKPNSTGMDFEDFTFTNNGIIVNNANPNAIARATIYLIKHPNIYASISYHSRRTIEKYFNIQIQIDKYTYLYQYLHRLFKE